MAKENTKDMLEEMLEKYKTEGEGEGVYNEASAEILKKYFDVLLLESSDREVMNKQAASIMNFLNGIMKDSMMTEEHVKEEVDSLNNRILDNSYARMSAMFLVQAGVQGATELLKTANDERSQLVYLRDEAINNPKKYAVVRAADILAKYGQFVGGQSGVTGLLTTMQGGKAEMMQGMAQFLSGKGNFDRTMASIESSGATLDGMLKAYIPLLGAVKRNSKEYKFILSKIYNLLGYTGEV